MYRIMIAQAKRDNYETLYKYLTTNIDGEVIPLELGSKEALDKRVEKMLNEEGYAKSDFIIVRVVDYTIDATAYTNTDADTVASPCIACFFKCFISFPLQSLPISIHHTSGSLAYRRSILPAAIRMWKCLYFLYV